MDIVDKLKKFETDNSETKILLKDAANEIKDLRKKLENHKKMVGSICRICHELDRKVIFEADVFGASTLTVFVGDTHTHIGSPERGIDKTAEQMVSLFVDRYGLSWVPERVEN